jgi:plastocyanin
VRSALALPVIAGCLLAAGCGGYGKSKSATEKAAVGPPLATIRISETEFRLTPSTIHLNKAGVYTFEVTNKGTVTHALEVESEGAESETPNIPPGETKTLTIRLTAGTRYELYCPIDGHEAKGMKGLLTAGPVAGATSTTTEDRTTTEGGGY